MGRTASGATQKVAPVSLEYIRKTYGVPAKRGSEVAYQPDTMQPPMVGRITGHHNALVRVRFPESKRPYLCHPMDLYYRATPTVPVAPEAK